MKKYLYILAAAAAVACTEKPAEQPSGTGRLQVSIAQSGAYVTKANDDVASFVVDIVRPTDGWKKHYDKYADMPEVLDLGGGDYTISVASPEKKDAAWDLPYYAGSQAFTIRVGELTPVSLTASLQNMKVSFKLTENFQKELSNYTISVTNASSWDAADAGGKTLVWSNKDDISRPGYFSVAPLRVKVDAYRVIDNSETHSELVISDVAPQDHHIITLDARVTGSLNGISITIDPSVNEKDSAVDVPGWDEVPVDGGGEGSGDDDPETPEVPTAPTMTWEANPSFEPTPIAAEMSVEILIKAPEAIKDFVVEVDSNVLGETIAQMAGDSYSYSEGRPYQMDLINNQALIQALNGMIPVGDQLSGKTEVLFSLSQLVPLIAVYAPESGSLHTFTLKVTDTKGQSLVKPVVFVAQ